MRLSEWTDSSQWTDSIKQALKWTGIGMAAFGVCYLSHRTITKYLKRGKEQKNALKNNKSHERLNTQRSEYSDYYFDKALEFRHIEESLLNLPTVEEIYQTSPILARDEFLKYTKQIRKRRRLVRKANEDQYVDLILQYERDVEDLLVRSRFELLEYLNIDLGDFNEMERRFEEYGQVHALKKNAFQILNSKLQEFAPRKKMSDQMLRQIIDEEMGFFQNKLYNRLRNKLQKDFVNQPEILTAVKALLEDIIYEKYGYESEDVQRKIRESTSFLVPDRQVHFSKMVADISGFSYDSLESQEDEDVSNEGKLKCSQPTAGRSSQVDEAEV